MQDPLTTVAGVRCAVATVPLGPEANPHAFGLAIGDLPLEDGSVLPDVVVAVQIWGTLAPDRSNAILIEHALTGDAHVSGAAGPGQPTPGWWPGVVGPDAAIDTDRWCVVATNVLGGCRGTTGPSTIAPDGKPWGSRFPQVTIRDQVHAEARVADLLNIDAWALVVGGSMGGMRAAEWAATFPDRTRGAAVIASCATATADQIAWGRAQTLAIELDPDYLQGDYYATGRSPDGGLGLARRIAHTTYRCADELEERFGPGPQPGEDPLRRGRFAVEGYLDHHAGKLAARFDAGTYVVLTRAMATHDIGRGRGGIAAVLRRFPGELLIAGVDSDRLFPLSLSRTMATARDREPVAVISSPSGHDGFLIETDQVSELLAAQLARLEPRVGVRVG
ncbi:homoserine O-acetyltransferase MetX [Demetria terragena]|uniref:homoserine O-acetyltransferase MetX n=1 Tax=Demetria terragena TaxID=63959 RepID=UPI00035E4069|nr:homoserine O-acetyltransferase [Demetria terragena]